MKILVVGIFLIAQIYGENFDRKVYSQDSTLCVESKGIGSASSTHASNEVSLIYNAEIEKFKTTFNSEGSSYLPIITELQIIKKVDPIGIFAFALGWSTFGEGYETFTGWLLRFEKTPSIVEWFRITAPRSFPGISYDSSRGEVAVLINKRNLDRISTDLTLNIVFSNGKRIELSKRRGIPCMGAVPYTNHPYGEPKEGLTDSLFCSLRIKAEETGFKIY
jgi:hypothetical protein